MSPAWTAVDVTTAQPSGSGAGWLVLGGNDAQQAQLQASYPQAQCLPTNTTDIDSDVKHIIWIAPGSLGNSQDDELEVDSQQRSVLALFKLVKAMLAKGLDDEAIDWTIITSQAQAVHPFEACHAAHAGVHGLVGSLAKEYPGWRFRLLDLPEQGDWPVADWFGLPFSAGGDPLALRGGQWFSPVLLPTNIQDNHETPYRQNGVYVVVGGAGGLGEAWSRWVIEHYQARVIWLGRRAQDAEITAKIDALAELGPKPVYIQADARDLDALSRAQAQITEQFGEVHGVVQSALDSFDLAISDMDQARFEQILSVKVAVSVQLARVFGHQTLDFMVFFSSMASFEKRGGFSGYSAGCAFTDGLVRQLNYKCAFRAKVMNWGYWSVGSGDRVSDAMKQRLADVGIAAIEIEEGMTALQTLLGGRLEQMVFVKTSKPGVIATAPESLTSYPESIPAMPVTPVTIPEDSAVFYSVKNDDGPASQVPDLVTMASKVLWSILASVGVFDDKSFTLDSLKTRKLYMPFFHRWMKGSLAEFVNRGELLLDGERYEVVKTDAVDSQTVWQEWDECKKVWLTDHAMQSVVPLLESCLKSLPEILRGDIQATDVVFPSSSVDQVSSVYKGHEAVDIYNEVLGQTLVNAIAGRIEKDSNCQIRILEIGAGTGGTTAGVLQKLKPYHGNIAEYCYTDISKAFLFHAEEHYLPGNPFINPKLFNAEKAIESQGIAPNSYDFVIATNVLHATRNMRTTLRNTKATMRRNGLLLLNEVTEKTLYAHLTFGMLEGWWVSEDEALRIPDCPCLSPENWAQLLQQEGFEQPALAIANGQTLGQQVIVAHSNGLVREAVVTKPKPVVEAVKVPVTQGPSASQILDKALYYFRDIIAKTLRMSPSGINVNEPLESYGIDSILVVSINNRLKRVFGEVSSTLLFECQTVQALAEHFIENQKDTLVSELGLEQVVSTPAPTPAKPQAKPKSPEQKPQAVSEDIAIIGLVGKYSGAETVEAFWQRLAAGEDCIVDVPPERWSLDGFFEPEPAKAVASGKSYCKSGGFIEGFADFDPLFFKVSPREAKSMDPQERLFLTSCWQVVEDAGYTRASLQQRYQGKVGVFAGVTKVGFSLNGPNLWRQGKDDFPYTSFSSVANRVSYLMNFTGPSMPVDTMCSAALTAIHEACEYLKRDECQLAIAGGVNVYMHPSNYIGLCSQRMLSIDGQCKSFGVGANGFVPGEGVGTVMLKRLSLAEADGDHIYGLIKATAINHGGKTNGYTVPNPNAQAEVISTALARANIDARTVSYIEAHGTGTELGDPIEITGLKKAFAAHTDSKDTGYCAIGAVKSNIGHGESAAGIAGISKILMQMKHGKIAPSLHTDELNPNINFANTPFTVQRELTDWQRPTLTLAGKTREYPRIAGVSGFGAGGSNAHIILQEYQGKPRGALNINHPLVLVLSAKSDAQLKQQASNLLEFIEAGNVAEADLQALCYTLQVGREAMEERAVTTLDDFASLKDRLSQLATAQDDMDAQDWTLGSVEQNKETLAAFMEDEEFDETVDKWLARGKYNKVIELWAKGLSFDWQRWYGDDVQPQRLSLPTYPFDLQTYWIDTEEATDSPVATRHLHPLVHENTSTSFDTRFTSRFTGFESFFTDHQVNGQKVMPGTGHIEMARAAVHMALDLDDSQSLVLRDVAWLRPIVMASSEPLAVHISVIELDDTSVEYDIYSVKQSGEEVVYSQGRAELAAPGDAPSIDLAAVQQTCREQSYSGESVYALFSQLGFNYGPAHSAMVELGAGHGDDQHPQALGQVLYNDSTQDFGEHGINPGLLDSVLQSTLGIPLLMAHSATETGEAKPGAPVPFALSGLKVYRALPAKLFAWVRYSQGSQPGDAVQKLDIRVCDEHGQVCVDFEQFTARILSEAPAVEASSDTLIYAPVWQEASVSEGQATDAQVILLGDFSEQDGAQLPNSELIKPTTTDLAEGYLQSAQALFAKLKACMQQAPKRVQVVIKGDLLAGLGGLVKTAQQENPNLQLQCIELNETVEPSKLATRLQADAADYSTQDIRYQDGKRFIKRWNEVSAKSQQPVWRDNGVYLITGGLGGLGLLVANAIAEQTSGAKVILTGRSELDQAGQDKLAQLKALGLEVIYKLTDVADEAMVNRLMAYIDERYGTLTGIFHCAGVLADAFIAKKDAADLANVFAPKVSGLVNLDKASSDFELEHFVCFSSAASAFGNPGQADYAAANGFMDCYVAARNQRVAQGQCHGRSVAINWPLWEEGGMQVDSAVRARMQQSGQAPLTTAQGLQALQNVVNLPEYSQLAVLAGDAATLRALMNPPEVVVEAQPQIEVADAPQLQTRALAYFKAQLAQALDLTEDQLKVDAPLEDYGMDSIVAMTLTNFLEQSFGPLSKTLFFEVQTVRALTEYFVNRHGEALQNVLGEPVSSKPQQAAPKLQPVTAPVQSATTTRRRRKRQPQIVQQTSVVQSNEPIAIIGVSGRYPESPNVDIFWENLKAGRDCVTEVPADRWDHDAIYDPDKNAPGKTYAKWGGFIADMDKFDPLFFSVSPRDANYIDPQERIFLQCVYSTLQDAGYTREALSQAGQNGSAIRQPGNVGVFVGVMYEEYQLYAAHAQSQGWQVGVPGNPSSIANRVSYWCNFCGPSMAVDTMCSSSLTAIHLAVQHLHKGSCDAAVAGGVNLSVHPNKYLVLSQGKFASTKGRCESFGAGGDGYVPGEGVGAVLLKPLAKAEADGDQIYALIKGTALNHGGKTNGYTVPNPRAQSEVIKLAFNDANIDPRTVSYIEAHGTGTSLGDPIEITGLAEAFDKVENSCAIGSVKSNVGHLEAAAGVAGITKILLQMKHRTLVPSLHSETLNPNIDFASTPFVVQQQLAEWPQPQVTIDGQTRNCPRIAGISSFGAGGSNAHIILQEYEAKPAAQVQAITAMAVISAKTTEQIIEQANNLLAHIEAHELDDSDLQNLCYTLQVGREAMDERAAVMVDNMADLQAKLSQLVDSRGKAKHWLFGSIKQQDTLAAFAEDEAFNDTIEKWCEQGKYRNLLELWVKGWSFDWSRLYTGAKPKRISLPTYPYAKGRYWLDVSTEPVAGGEATAKQLSPLLHENTSTGFDTRFTSHFTGKEFFLADHQVQGHKVLPGAGQLEMARLAVIKTLDLPAGQAIALQDVVWLRPIIQLDDFELVLHISVNPLTELDCRI